MLKKCRKVVARHSDHRKPTSDLWFLLFSTPPLYCRGSHSSNLLLVTGNMKFYVRMNVCAPFFICDRCLQPASSFTAWANKNVNAAPRRHNRRFHWRQNRNFGEISPCFVCWRRCGLRCRHCCGFLCWRRCGGRREILTKLAAVRWAPFAPYRSC